MDRGDDCEVIRDSEVDSLPLAVVPVASLVATGSPRLAGENSQHVRLLAGSPGRLPPIIVHRPAMRVIDGMHRLRAAQLRGDEQVEIRYFDGDEAAAFVLAVRLNVQHGLPLALADRKDAADRILGLYPQWSDRMIASAVGLSPPTVAARRRSLTEKNSQSAIRIGKDGRARPADIAQRRQIAARVLADSPAASLRQVASQAGLSRETVRKIRHELKQAHEPALSPSPRGEMADDPLHHVSRRPAADELTSINARAWQALRADPAFRSTDSGRTLLRVLAGSQALHDRLDQIIGAAPAHCLGRLGDAARHCAGRWLELAAQAEQRQLLLEAGWKSSE